MKTVKSGNSNIFRQNNQSQKIHEKTVKSRQGNEDIQKNRSHPGQNNKAKAETGTGSF